MVQGFKRLEVTLIGWAFLGFEKTQRYSLDFKDSAYTPPAASQLQRS